MQARSCWPASMSVNETVFINTTYDEDAQTTPPVCGETITNCYANITKSNFISLKFQVISLLENQIVELTESFTSPNLMEIWQNFYKKFQDVSQTLETLQNS